MISQLRKIKAHAVIMQKIHNIDHGTCQFFFTEIWTILSLSHLYVLDPVKVPLCIRFYWNAEQRKTIHL